MKVKNMLLLLIPFTLLYACKTPMIISTSEKDATITVNGIEQGAGRTSLLRLGKNKVFNVKIEKTGFLTAERKIYYQGLKFKPVNEFVELHEDDAYIASVQNDYANKDFEVEVAKSTSAADAWKKVSQIVTSYIDNLEMTDNATGYMKTGWQLKTFSGKTVRTRIIVKQSSTDPLKYKIKIVSEYTKDLKASIKDDEKFREWDRVLRTYKDVVTEFQDRLKGN
jgi:hypothetical protein